MGGHEVPNLNIYLDMGALAERDLLVVVALALKDLVLEAPDHFLVEVGPLMDPAWLLNSYQASVGLG